MAAKASRKPPVPEQSAEAKKIAELERKVAKQIDQINNLERRLETSERQREGSERRLTRKTILLDDAQRVVRAQAVVIADMQMAEIERHVDRVCDMEIPF